MPAITLSDTTFAKLKSIAEPFVDTPESLVARLIDSEVERRGIAAAGNGHTKPAAEYVRMKPYSPENLAFTRVLSATVDGKEIYRPKWNTLMNYVHILGLKRLGSLDDLEMASGARLRKGRYESDGFKYLPEGDFSIQGVDANLAWSNSLVVARKIGVPIEVYFDWRDKPGAAHPGRVGVLEWKPEK